jgi:hypothetical protein
MILENKAIRKSVWKSHKSFMGIGRNFHFKQFPKSRIHFAMPFFTNSRFPALPSPQALVEQFGGQCLRQSCIFAGFFNLQWRWAFHYLFDLS